MLSPVGMTMIQDKGTVLTVLTRKTLFWVGDNKNKEEFPMPISKVQDGPPSPATAGSVCAFASASNPAYGVAGNERAENVVESPRVLQPDCLAARAGRFYTAIRWQEVDISLIQSVTLE